MTKNILRGRGEQKGGSKKGLSKRDIAYVTQREVVITGRKVKGSDGTAATSFESGFEAAGTTAAGQEATEHFRAKVGLRLC